MITILADFQSPRLVYVVDTIFKKWLNLNYKIVASPDEVDPDSCCIAYGRPASAESITMFNEGLLTDTTLRSELPRVSTHQELPVIFEVENPEAYDLPFDVFSAVFFCLSRYEEYVISKRDEHGRYRAKDSIFYGYHRIPYVDRWILLLERLIQKQLPDWKNPRSLHWLSTMDMDIAFAYKGRSAFHILGASAKDLMKRRFDRVRERISVLSGKAPDPFDTYRIFLEEDESDSKMLFVPAGDRGGLDTNLNVENEWMHQHISSLGKKVRMGLHPSYRSLGKAELIEKEKFKLERITGSAITSSRQHFLRFKLPETMTSLQSLGITKEFSMGFHDEIGFRSGTAYGHHFFDLIKNQALPIELMPLTAMDSALKNHLGLSPEEAIEAIKAVLQGMQKSGGTFTSVWHNHSLSETEDWKGWRSVFSSTADMVRSLR